LTEFLLNLISRKDRRGRNIAFGNDSTHLLLKVFWLLFSIVSTLSIVPGKICSASDGEDCIYVTFLTEMVAGLRREIYLHIFIQKMDNIQRKFFPYLSTFYFKFMSIGFHYSSLAVGSRYISSWFGTASLIHSNKTCESLSHMFDFF